MIWHNPGFEHCTPRLDLTRLRSLFWSESLEFEIGRDKWGRALSVFFMLTSWDSRSVVHFLRIDWILLQTDGFRPANYDRLAYSKPRRRTTERSIFLYRTFLYRIPCRVVPVYSTRPVRRRRSTFPSILSFYYNSHVRVVSTAIIIVYYLYCVYEIICTEPKRYCKTRIYKQSALLNRCRAAERRTRAQYKKHTHVQ